MKGPNLSLKLQGAALALLLVLTPLAACQTDDVQETTPLLNTETTADNPGETSAATDAPDETEAGGQPGNPHLEDLENADITIVYWYNPDQYELDKTRNEAVYDPVLEAIPVYEEQTGGTVTVEATDWNGMQQRVVDLVNAGEAPDLMEVYDRNFHPSVFGGLIQPINDYVTDADYDWYQVKQDLFSWKDDVYAIPLKPFNYLMLYNKDMISLAGLEDPLDVFLRGEWTFAKFAEYGEALQREVNGEVTQWGFGSWQDALTSFMLANGGALINVDQEAGTAEAGFEDASVVETLELIAPWYGPANGFIMSPSDDSFFNFWEVNQLGFIRGPDLPQDEVPFELGAVPYPTGPSGPEKNFVVYPQGMAVPAGASNPQGAAAFMYTVNEVQRDVGDVKERARIGDALFEAIYAEDVIQVYAYDKAPTDIDGLIASMINYMMDGMPPATVIATLQPELDAMVQRTFSGN